MNQDKAEGRVWFPGWAEVLAQEPWPENQQEAYQGVVAWYLHECKERRWSVNLASARRFIETVERERQPPADPLAAWKEGLNWFFRQAARAGASPAAPGVWRPPADAGTRNDGLVMSDGPSLGGADLGRTDWEPRLIQQLRSRKRAWCTEQTYRGWAWRLAKFLEPRPVESATEADIREFLSPLATEGRVSVRRRRSRPHAARDLRLRISDFKSRGCRWG